MCAYSVLLPSLLVDGGTPELYATLLGLWSRLLRQLAVPGL
jgi:hypothetical protein